MPIKPCVACWVFPCAPRGRLTAGDRSRHSGVPLAKRKPPAFRASGELQIWVPEKNDRAGLAPQLAKILDFHFRFPAPMFRWLDNSPLSRNDVGGREGHSG